MYKSTRVKIIFLIITVSVGFLSLLYFSNSFKNTVLQKFLTVNQSIGQMFLLGGDGVFTQDESLHREVKLLEMENEKLRTELGLRASSSASYISLELLGDRSNLYGTWYVRKPENKLLYSGQYILGRDNVAVGSVVKDLGGTAEVTYLAHSDKLIIEILERNELIEVEGSGVGMYHGQIPKSSEITIGDTAVLRGYNKSVVGIVSKVDENDTSLKTIWIRAPYNLSKLDIFYAAVE